MTNQIHIMRLNEPWFSYVKSGEKIYEGRRATEKVNSIQIGDILSFISVQNPLDVLNTTVVDVLSFNTFQDALNRISLTEVLPGIKSIEDGVKIYYKYVSLETQLKDGVKMIRCKQFLSDL